MPTPIKEYREFFLRHAKVSSGNKIDQETNYILQYNVNIGGIIKNVFNRFLKNDFPSGDVFKKLFESQTFKLNQEDTAKLAEQGLVKIATDANAENSTSNLSTDFTAVIVPHQLPNLIVTPGVLDSAPTALTDNGIKLTDYRRTFVSGLFKKVTKVEVVVQNSIVIDGATKMLKLSGDTTSPGNYKVYGTNDAGTKGWYDSFPVGGIILWSGSIVNIPTGWLLCNGSFSTPDLRNLFVVGAGGTYAPGDIGGADTVSLTGAQSGIKSHLHSYNDTQYAIGTTEVQSGTGTVVLNSASPNDVPRSTGNASDAATAHENRPPYLALAYIMKT